MKSTRKNVDAKLNNLKSRIQGRSQDLFRGSHNSPKAPNPVRHLLPPAPPMSPKVEVTVSLSVFTISKITSCVYFHVLRTTSDKRKFHAVVVQGRQRNVPKSVLNMQKIVQLFKAFAC